MFRIIYERVSWVWSSHQLQLPSTAPELRGCALPTLFDCGGQAAVQALIQLLDIHVGAAKADDLGATVHGVCVPREVWVEERGDDWVDPNEGLVRYQRLWLRAMYTD